MWLSDGYLAVVCNLATAPLVTGSRQSRSSLKAVQLSQLAEFGKHFCSGEVQHRHEIVQALCHVSEGVFRSDDRATMYMVGSVRHTHLARARDL